MKALHRQNCQLCLTPQNVREFWNVCTRPTDHNGLGISVPGTERHARFLERYFTVLPDSALTYSTWRQLAAAHNVLGVKVHDAWLVAAMKAHGASNGFLRLTPATSHATTESSVLIRRRSDSSRRARWPRGTVMTEHRATQSPWSSLPPGMLPSAIYAKRVCIWRSWFNFNAIVKHLSGRLVTKVMTQCWEAKKPKAAQGHPS